jgi:hypothetical protein
MLKMTWERLPSSLNAVGLVQARRSTREQISTR